MTGGACRELPMLTPVRSLFFAAVFSVGCVPTQGIELPDIPATGAALMLVNDGSSRVEAWALGPNDAAPRFALGSGDRVWFLVYANSSLELLNIQAGKLQLDLRTDAGRLLPQGFVLHEALAERPSFEVINDLSQLERVVGRRPLPDFETNTCAGDNSCQLYVGPGLETASESPCLLPTPEPPQLPAPAALPRFETCPPGWSHQALDSLAEGLRVCRPPSRQAICPDGAFQPTGSSACIPLGSCPPEGEDFTAVAGPALYVHADAAAGGDGSQANPLATITDALRQTPATIVLSKGIHVAPSTLSNGVTVIGACARDTVINVGEGILFVTDAHLRALSVQGVDVPALPAFRATVELRGVVTLDDVEVRALQPLAVDGGQVTAQRLRLRVNSSAGRYGVHLFGNASIDWAGGTVESAINYGIYAEASLVTLDNVFVDTVTARDVRSIAVFARRGGSNLTMRRSSTGQATGNHISVWEGTGVVEDVAFDGSVAGSDGNILDAHLGGVIDARRIVANNVDHGPWAFGIGTIRLEDAVIMNTAGNGSTVHPDSTLSMKRSVLANIGGDGVRIRNTNANNIDGTVGPILELEDVLISGAGGRGINAEVTANCQDWPYLGLTSRVDRLHIKNTGNDGVRLFSSSNTSEWNDVTIDGTGRHGFLAAIDSAVPLHRVHISGARRVGLWMEQYRMDLPTAQPFTRTITVEDLTVDRSQRAVMASGMLLDAKRWSLTNSSHSGLAVIASEGSLQDIAVDTVQAIELGEPFADGRVACFADIADSFPGFASGCIGFDPGAREVGTGVHFCGYRVFNIRPLFETEMTLSRATVSNVARYGVSAYLFSAPKLMDVAVVQAEDPADSARAGIVMSAGLDPERVLSTDVRLQCVSRALAVE